MPLSTLTQTLDHNASQTHVINYLRSNNDETDVSFKELRQRALGILFNLQEQNILPDEQLIILTNNNEFFLDAFWASLYGGIIPVPVAISSNDEHRFKLLRIFNKLESSWIYCSEKTQQQLHAFCLDNNLAADAEKMQKKCILIESISDISQPGTIHPCTADDIAFIQFSSGSTSEPKGIVLTHKNLLTNIYDIIEGAKITNDDRMLSWMPLTHDMGMIGCHLTAIVARINHTIMDTAVFVRRPLLWLTAASDKRATILGSPNFGYKHFLKAYTSKGIVDIDLSNIRLIFNGAEPISLDLCNHFLKTMADYGLKTSAMFPVYGLAEASLAVTFPDPIACIESVRLNRHHLGIGDTVSFSGKQNDGALNETSFMEFVLTGTPIQNCQVRITDTENQTLPENTVGRIQLKGDNVTNGYYLAEDINKQLISDDGWLDTGDLGAFIRQQLIITGRIKDIIFVNGQNFYAHDLENILHNLDGLELGKVIACGARKPHSDEDELIIFVLYRSDIAAFIPLLHSIRKTINETTGAEVHQIIPIKRIPKTTSGKVQRHLLTDEYIDDEFDGIIQDIEARLTLSQSTEHIDPTSLQQQILQLCNTTIADKTINASDNLFEIGISSLLLAEIHEQLDEMYPGKIDISDLFDHPTVAELTRFLETKINQK